jgi:hypothetical protein
MSGCQITALDKTKFSSYTLSVLECKNDTMYTKMLKYSTPSLP